MNIKFLIFYLYIISITFSNCKYEDFDCSEGCKTCPQNKVKVGDRCIDLKKEGYYYCTTPCICLDTMAISISRSPSANNDAGLILFSSVSSGSSYTTSFGCRYLVKETGDSIATTAFGFYQFCDFYPNNKLYPFVTGKFVNKSYWDLKVEWRSLKTDTVVTTCNLMFRQ